MPCMDYFAFVNQNTTVFERKNVSVLQSESVKLFMSLSMIDFEFKLSNLSYWFGDLVPNQWIPGYFTSKTFPVNRYIVKISSNPATDLEFVLMLKHLNLISIETESIPSGFGYFNCETSPDNKCLGGNKKHFIVMQNLSGQVLTDMILGNRIIDTDLQKIVLLVIRSIWFLDKHKVTHNNLVPDNIIVKRLDREYKFRFRYILDDEDQTTDITSRYIPILINWEHASGPSIDETNNRIGSSNLRKAQDRRHEPLRDVYVFLHRLLFIIIKNNLRYPSTKINIINILNLFAWLHTTEQTKITLYTQHLSQAEESVKNSIINDITAKKAWNMYLYDPRLTTVTTQSNRFQVFMRKAITISIVDESAQGKIIRNTDSTTPFYDNFDTGTSSDSPGFDWSDPSVPTTLDDLTRFSYNGEILSGDITKTLRTESKHLIDVIRSGNFPIVMMLFNMFKRITSTDIWNKIPEGKTEFNLFVLAAEKAIMNPNDIRLLNKHYSEFVKSTRPGLLTRLSRRLRPSSSRVYPVAETEMSPQQISPMSSQQTTPNVSQRSSPELSPRRSLSQQSLSRQSSVSSFSIPPTLTPLSDEETERQYAELERQVQNEPSPQLNADAFIVS